MNNPVEDEQLNEFAEQLASYWLYAELHDWRLGRARLIEQAKAKLLAWHSQGVGEARIDELQNRLKVQFIPSHWGRLCAETNSWAKYVDRRIADLKAQLRYRSQP